MKDLIRDIVVMLLMSLAYGLVIHAAMPEINLMRAVAFGFLANEAFTRLKGALRK
jgi:hypothetical protein